MLKSYQYLIITAGLAFLSLLPPSSIAASSPADDDNGATPLDELLRRWDYDVCIHSPIHPPDATHVQVASPRKEGR